MIGSADDFIPMLNVCVVQVQLGLATPF